MFSQQPQGDSELGEFVLGFSWWVKVSLRTKEPSVPQGSSVQPTDLSSALVLLLSLWSTIFQKVPKCFHALSEVSPFSVHSTLPQI